MDAEPRSKTGREVRMRARSSGYNGQTAGQAPDFLQGNLVILPLKYAGDFLRFCLNNPKPCPLIGVSNPGDHRLPELGEDLDIRTDIPRYLVYRHGVLTSEETDISELWSNDLVSFVLGCSFTFEEALLRNGFPLRHIEQGRSVPMYKTNIETMPGGIFNGPLVVSMRSFPESQVPAVFDLTAQYPHAHGTPVYWGDPNDLGIVDLQSPDYGAAISVPENEVPVFWACGVTPQAAIERSKPDLCITHAPSCMLVTDVPSSAPPPVKTSLSRF